MADYQRVVSYIYLYNHQLKGNNIGFARLETRNKQCKFTIHVRVPSIADQIVKAYIYCWHGKTMHGVLLGNVHIQNGIGELQLMSDTGDICNSNYKLSEMAGIIIYLSDTQFLGTEWDDRQIIFDTMIVDVVKPQEQLQEGQQEVAQEIPIEEPVIEEPVIEENAIEETVIEEMVIEEPVIQGELASSILEEPSIDLGFEEKDLVMEEQNNDSVSEESSQDEEVFCLKEASIILKEEEQKNEFPLSEEKINSLDQQAERIFGNMVESVGTQGEEVSTKEEDEIVSQRDDEEEVKAESLAQDGGAVIVSPKSAIECFTAFKSCESNEEYEEIQDEIGTLQAKMSHLEMVSEEWKMKEAKQKEEEQAREQERLELEAKLRESIGIGEDLYISDISQQNVAQEEADAKVSGVVTRIFAKYPKMNPFEGEADIEDCVRIEPQDIGIFPMENWILANNSFLLHGYYSYRHLIFVMCNQNGTKEYFLGVPGINHSRESFMAKMFGFNTFRKIPYEDEQAEEFGYWCMPIKMK